MTIEQARVWLWLAAMYRAAGRSAKAREVYRCAQDGLNLRADLARRGEAEPA